MIIDELVLHDFRVFSGEHTFDLAPRQYAGTSRPIILFGGLNGAGKTSILTALKLAIYGRGVLGSVSLADYHLYLAASIHKTVNNPVAPHYSAVQISFRHAHHGKFSSYKVKRDWSLLESGKIKENLSIVCDGDLKSELSYDQAQAFLNELIPIGVSELFFFDGEKIKELAEETTGSVLKGSIEKLLGLDVVARLDSDLSVLIRTRSSKDASKERLKSIEALELELSVSKENLAIRQIDYQVVDVSYKQLQKNIEMLQKEIDARGGAWSLTKKDEAIALNELRLKKEYIEAALREVVSSTLPLNVTRGLNKKLLFSLQVESELKSKIRLGSVIAAKRGEFIKRTNAFSNKNDLVGIFDSLFSDLQVNEKVSLVHDLSDTQVSSMGQRIEQSEKHQLKRAKSLVGQLEEVEDQIDSIGINLGRAPDDEVMKPLTSKLQSMSVDLGEARANRARLSSELRQLVGVIVELSRKLDRLYNELADSANKNRLFELAENSRVVLKNFIKRTSERKVRELEVQFQMALEKLSRKNNSYSSISIDEKSYSVTLCDSAGLEVNKNELSAGEKQIYAIALLEGLARTSGRNLPVIIDTPLGRLDSHHRKNLVKHYFPEASHQVLILSTDTEITSDFYKDLRDSISHTYYLDFDHKSGSTKAYEKYFFEGREGNHEFS